jgi:hypothetical protein
MRKSIITMIVALGCTTLGFSQSNPSSQSSDYQSSIGIRFGTGYYDLVSGSFKTFLASSPGALEIDLGVRPDSYGGADVLSVSLQGSYQYHFNIPNVPGFKWFIGGGVSFSNTSVNYHNNPDYTGYTSGFGMGIFPTGGLDYKFAGIPLALTADLRPVIGLVRPNDYYNYFYASFGISARYTLK